MKLCILVTSFALLGLIPKQVSFISVVIKGIVRIFPHNHESFSSFAHIIQVVNLALNVLLQRISKTFEVTLKGTWYTWSPKMSWLDMWYKHSQTQLSGGYPSAQILIFDVLSINKFHWNFAPCISGILKEVKYPQFIHWKPKAPGLQKLPRLSLFEVR